MKHASENNNFGGNTRHCPVCKTESKKAKLFAHNTIDTAKLSSLSFASRKIPEFMSHRLLRCLVCDLVYADQPPCEEVLALAYHEADFDSSDEADDAAKAYIKIIKPILKCLVKRQKALEIGCGTGAFLEYLRYQGFTEVVGIEPSGKAIAAAPLYRQAWISHGVFEQKDFALESFDLICCFMTLEHVRDPQDIVKSVFKLLRPGGLFIAVTHDYKSMVNRMLGSRSPIIDVEHMQLFSTKNLQILLENEGFQNIKMKTFRNTYKLSYWLNLIPIANIIKIRIKNFLLKTRFEKIKLSINVGNLIIHGFK